MIISFYKYTLPTRNKVKNMAGWDLKSGALQYIPVSEYRLWTVFNFIFSDAAAKRSTYKFGLIKAILDNLFNCTIINDEFVLFHQDIFTKFTENYWNLVLKYHLKQLRPDDKSKYSHIERIFMQVQKNYQLPVEIPFNSLDDALKKQIIFDVQKSCKKNVLGALYKDLEGIVYGFDLEKDYLVLHPVAYQFMMKYKMELERLNYYAWAKFLETINEDSVLIKLLDKLELALPQRKNLDIFRNILYEEFKQENCFYCGKKLNNTMHVDHFIPWSFMKEDNLWNFVLTCPVCNTRKNNKLPEQIFVKKLEIRNSEIILLTDFSKEQFESYQPNLISNLWQYAYYAGFKEFKVK